MKIMKTLKTILVSTFLLLFLSCDSNEDANPLTTCESDFFGLSSSTSYMTSGDTFQFGKYRKSGSIGPLTSLSSGNSLSGTTGWMNFYSSTFNPTLNQLTCLLPSNNLLLKCNATTGVTTSTTINNVCAPAYVGTSLRLLKYASVIQDTSTSFPYITSVNVQIVDDAGSPISAAVTLTLTSKSLGDIKSITSVSTGTKIYYLANCELIIYDTLSNTFQVKTIDSYDNDTDRKFYQGLEFKNANTLVALKQTVIPTTKIEVNAITISNLSPSVLPSNSIFNMTSSMLPSSAPSLSLIINSNEYRTTTFDTCDDNYYFTYTTPSVVASAGTRIFELKLNSASVNVYPDSGSIIFSLEKGL